MQVRDDTTPAADQRSDVATTDVVDEARSDPATDSADDLAAPRRFPGGSVLGTPRWAVELPLLTGALAALAAVVYRVWEREWSIPFAGGDLLAHAAVLDSTGWTGTPAPSETLGAPYGVAWSDMPNGADRVHLIVLRGLRALTGDSISALNVYMVLAVVLVGVATYVVVRCLGVSALSSGVAALVFAIAPVHFARMAVGHAYLVAYFAVPIGLWLALWATQAQLPLARRRSSWVLPAVLVVVLGSSSVYYATFAAVWTAGLGVLLALRRGRWVDLLRPLGVAGATMAVVGVNIAGEVLARGRGGEAGVRLVLDSDSYGLRVAQMLLPVPDHRVGVLAQWSDQAYRVLAPGDRGAPVGLVALIGLVALLACCIRIAGRPASVAVPPDGGWLGRDVPGRDGVLVRLAALAVLTVGVAAVGGGGMLVATLGFTQIRAWSRMAVLVCLVGVVVTAMLLDGLFRTRRLGTAARWAVAVLVVGVAVFDQISPSSIPDPLRHAAERRADVELATELEQSLEDGAMVFQLPVGAFPAEAPVGDIGANDLLGPALAGSGGLRWNVGALAGRDGDWQRSIETLPTARMLDALAAAGFAAVVVDHRAEPSDPTSADAAFGDAIVEQLGAADGTSSDGTRSWWDLRQRRAQLIDRLGAEQVASLGAAAVRPIGVVVEGSPGIRSTARPRDRHVGERSTIRLTRYGGSDEPVRVRMSIRGEPGATVVLDSGTERLEVVLRSEPSEIELDVDVAGREQAEISIRTDAAPLAGVSRGWGDLRLELTDLVVLDPLLLGGPARR